MPAFIGRRGKVHGVSTAQAAAQPQPPLISRVGSLFTPTFTQTAPPTGFGPVAGAQFVRDHAGPAASLTAPVGAIPFASLGELESLIGANAANSSFYATATSYSTTRNITWTAGKNPKIYFPYSVASNQKTITGAAGNFTGFTVPSGGAEFHGGKFTSFGDSSSTSASAITATDNGTVLLEDCEFTNNWRGFSLGAGTTTGNGPRIVRRCRIYSNLAYGFTSAGSTANQVQSFLFENNRCYNNQTITGTDYGTCKILHCGNGIWRNNWIYDTRGLAAAGDSDTCGGLWWDANDNTSGGHQIHDNVFDDMFHRAIFYEISKGGTRMHHNLFKDCGYGPGTFGTFSVLSETAISISNADGLEGVGTGIEVDHNRIEGETNPISVYDTSTHYKSGAPNGDQCKAINIHDNAIYIRDHAGARIGANYGRMGYNDVHDLNLTATPPASFSNNQYHIQDYPAGAADHWEWDGHKTWAQWQALGFDTSGSIDSNLLA